VGIVFKNNAKTTLSSAVNNSTTTIPVTDGSVFPAVDLAGAGTFFLLTLEEDGNSPAIEIVKVTTCSGASGNINLTVVRAQEGTSATAFDSGDKAELRFTSGTIDHIRSDNTVHTNIFTTANASTTAFTLNQAVTDENDLVVFIDGVFQAHNTYTVSGTTLTLATAPASGRVVTAYSIKGLRSATNVAIATMTGDNSDTTLTLPIEPINENSVQVFFDGVYQNKSTFSVSGTTLTFSTAPPTGVEVEAILLTQTNIDTAAILKDADGDTKIQVEESSDEDKIRFDTGGTERAIIDSSGIKIIHDDQKGLKFNTANTAESFIDFGDTDNDAIGRISYDHADDSISFRTSATQYLKLSAQGTLNFPSPTSFSGQGNGTIGHHSNNYFYINGGSAGAVLQDNSSGSNRILLRDSNTIEFEVNGSERMRITSDGKLGIGTTAPDEKLQVDGKLKVSSYFGTGTAVIIQNNDSSDNYSAAAFYSGGTVAGYIFVNGSLNSTSYQTTSDYRVKENINYDFDALDRVKQLKPARFNFIADETNTLVDGFLAHEVSDIVPEAISGEKDGEQMQGIDQSKLVPLLTKAIQELSAKVEELEGKIE